MDQDVLEVSVLEAEDPAVSVAAVVVAVRLVVVTVVVRNAVGQVVGVYCVPKPVEDAVVGNRTWNVAVGVVVKDLVPNLLCNVLVNAFPIFP